MTGKKLPSDVQAKIDRQLEAQLKRDQERDYGLEIEVICRECFAMFKAGPQDRIPVCTNCLFF